jgi:hypothetical protein
MPPHPNTGIPRIIHQTWRDRDIPESVGDPQSWRRLNPTWAYMFWSDADLLDFFQTQRPDLLTLYESYPNPVQRADLARYCLLQKFGGIYADIDTRCLRPIDVLAGDPRVVLCEEPREQAVPAIERGLDRLWFNGTMASPAGHPFWADVISKCELMAPRRFKDVLETTGPLILSASVDQWPDQSQLALNTCTLFSQLTAKGELAADPEYGPFGHLRLSEHLWNGSWHVPRAEKWAKRKIGQVRQFRHKLVSRNSLVPAREQARIDRDLLHSDLPATDHPAEVSIVIPLRDAAEFLPRLFELLLNIEHPRTNLSILFGHSRSKDNTAEMLAEFKTTFAHLFQSVRIVDPKAVTVRYRRSQRWHPKVQAKRRAGLARVRNELLGAALEEPCDWVLWMDADLVDYPADIIAQILAPREKIVVPDCVRILGGPSFDLNSFLSVYKPSRTEYFRYVCKGLLQPPESWHYRRHLHDLRYLPRVPLSGVGGTTLLVHADVHRAGVTFPERPYRDLIETEGFGQLARDVGVIPIGLPQIQVCHANS